jgi:hypothetical protein
VDAAVKSGLCVEAKYVNLIGNGTLALLQNPEQFERLKQDTSLIKPAAMF